jgi:hypothetical protein
MGGKMSPQLPKYGKNDNVYKKLLQEGCNYLGNFPPIPEDWEKTKREFYSNSRRLGENNRKIISSNYERLG